MPFHKLYLYYIPKLKMSYVAKILQSSYQTGTTKNIGYLPLTYHIEVLAPEKTKKGAIAPP